MNIRHYTKEYGITEDYYTVRNFLLKKGNCEYTYARWDWMTTHYFYLDREHLSSMGIAEENGECVGTVLFDGALGWCTLLLLPKYREHRAELLKFAEENLRDEKGELSIICDDTDREFQSFLAEQGYIATENHEQDAVFFPGETSTEYVLPEAYHITDLEESFEPDNYNRVCWNGFNHQAEEGEYELGDKFVLEKTVESLKRPNVELKLKVFAADREGRFVAHCGMWYDPAAGYAVVEPVCTDPKHRKLGLGKAVVLEGIERVRKLGCREVYVGSGQQFYYSIGFRPYRSSTEWRKKK